MVNQFEESVTRWKAEAKSYLKANRHARNPQAMAATSALSDAQECIEWNILQCNFLMNVAKFIINMTADEVQAILESCVRCGDTKTLGTNGNGEWECTACWASRARASARGDVK